MTKHLAVWLHVLIFGLVVVTPAANAQVFTFKIKESGVYKISADQAAKLGLEISELGVFGYPGLLPQLLDSAQLELQEIPTLEQDDNLYVFLSGPNTFTYSSDGLEYEHHLFADSLSYLIGKRTNPKRIIKTPALADSPDPDQIWYSFTTFKAEQINLLSSGRNWYSTAIRQGQSLNINLNLSTETDHPWILHGKLMAHSYSSSSMRVLSGNELWGEVTFNSIPNSTYGVKGREQVFDWEINPGNTLPQLRFTFQGSGSESAGYLDYIAVGVPFTNSHLKEGIFEAAVPQKISLPPNLHAWDISDFYNPVAIETSTGQSASGKKWVIFAPTKTPEPQRFKTTSLSLRDLTTQPELLIITASSLLSSANRLTNHKQSRGIETTVVTTDDIFQAFGYGNPDITAIRNFIAKVYHSNSDLKNVLLLGKGTFDYKGKLGGRPNLVPIYSSRESLNPLTSFGSDDYFGLLDFGQGNWGESREGDESLKIGIGRLPAINSQEANTLVDKIIAYESKPRSVSKSLSVSFLADDGDNNIHVRDAELHSEFLARNHPELLLNKLYLDRFEQEKSGATQRSLQTKAALEKTLEEGTLLLNFIGHGNETTLTSEEVFRVEDIANWSRQEDLAVWITATCEFGRHDSPFIRSAAEELLIASEKGAVGILTTGRPVFSSVNFAINEAFIEEAFSKHEGRYPDLGTILKTTKNKSLNGALNRNFSLLGDPSMRLALPDLDIKVTNLEDGKTGIAADTLHALREVIIRAEIVDPITEAFLPGFNGNFHLELRDRLTTSTTRGDESALYEFPEENVLLFRGTGKVVSGKLEARLLIPKELQPDFGLGKIRIQAWDIESGLQAMGIGKTLIGGAGPTTSDNTPPEIWLEINGQLTSPFVFSSPNLQIRGIVSDESGINISGINPGQLLSIQINDLPPVILNEDFVATDGNYQTGYFDNYFGGFTEGNNTITIKAWDNAGNGAEQIFNVEISGSTSARILAHKIFPNPASTQANFEVTHNRIGENVLLNLAVYSLTGQILFEERYRFQKAERDTLHLSWSFLQSQTKYPAKGTYIYKLTLQSESDFTSDLVSGKLVIQ